MMMMLRFCIDPNCVYSIVIPDNAFVERPEPLDGKEKNRTRTYTRNISLDRVRISYYMTTTKQNSEARLLFTSDLTEAPGGPRKPLGQDAIWSHMVPYGPIWPQMGPDGSIWLQMGRDGPR